MIWVWRVSGTILMGLMLVSIGWAQEAPSLQITPGDREITVSWSPYEGDFSHYELYRSVYNGYIRVDREKTSYTDVNLDNGITYYYALVAVDHQGKKREIARRTPGTPIDLAPKAPQGLTASGRNQEVRLRWTPNRENDLARYLLYRTNTEGALPSDASPVATLKKTDSTYVDTAVSNETLYYYTLVAVDETWNRSAGVQTLGAPGHVPEGLTALSGDQMVSLKWQPNAVSGMSHYVLFRALEKKEKPTEGDMIARIEIADSTYTDTGLQYGQTYYYYLALVNDRGYANLYVDPVVGVPQDLAPQPPGGLQVTTAVHDAMLAWSASQESDVANYLLYRSLESESTVEAEIPIAQLNREQTQYTDPGLKAGTTYYYFLVAEDTSGKRSIRSPQVSATIPKPRYRARDLTFFMLAAQFFLIPLAIGL